MGAARSTRFDRPSNLVLLRCLLRCRQAAHLLGQDPAVQEVRENSVRCLRTHHGVQPRVEGEHLVGLCLDLAGQLARGTQDQRGNLARGSASGQHLRHGEGQKMRSNGAVRKGVQLDAVRNSLVLGLRLVKFS